MSYFDNLITGERLKSGIHHEILTAHDHEAACDVIRTKTNFVGNQINWQKLKNFENFNHLKKEDALDLLAKKLQTTPAKKFFYRRFSDG